MSVTVPGSAPLASWGSSIEWIDPRQLTDHALWAELLGLETPSDEEKLGRFTRDQESLRITTITDDTCASGINVILDGHRSRRAAVSAGVQLIPCVRRIGLTADAEEVVILETALVGQHARKLPPSRVAALELRLYEARRRMRGARTDLATPAVATNGSGPREDTLAIMARETGRPRNEIANRLKVFGSPLAPQALRDAVDAEKVSLTRAAAEVRTEEAAPEAKAVLKLAREEGWSPDKLANHPVITDAQAAVNERVNGGQKAPRRPRPPETVELYGVDQGGVIRAEGVFARRRVRVEIEGLRVRLAQVADVPSVESVPAPREEAQHADVEQEPAQAPPIATAEAGASEEAFF